MRPKNHGCHGTTVETHGISFSSHASLTGFAVSGVPETSMMSTLSFRIRSFATSLARFGFDWLSFTRIDTGYCLPPIVMPPFSAVCICWIVKRSASPNGASGPVCGDT